MELKHKKETDEILSLMINFFTDSETGKVDQLKYLNRIDEIIDKAVKNNVLLHNVSNPKGTVCLEHDWKGDSFDHFGFCLEEVCENCGEKRQTGC